MITNQWVINSGFKCSFLSHGKACVFNRFVKLPPKLVKKRMNVLINHQGTIGIFATKLY